MLLYFDNLEDKKSLDFKLVDSKIIDSLEDTKIGKLTQCGRYLSVLLPKGFEVKQEFNNKDVMDGSCLLTHKSRSSIIIISESTQQWEMTLKSVKGFLANISTMYSKKTLSKINSSPNIFKQFISIFESAKSDQRVFSLEENVYAQIAISAIRPKSKEIPTLVRYQEIEGHTIIENYEPPVFNSPEYSILYPNGKVILLKFVDLSETEVTLLLPLYLQKNSVVFDSDLFKKDNDRKSEIMEKELSNGSGP